MSHVTITLRPGDTLASAKREEHSRSPDLKTLQRLVGGYIETVPHLTSFDYAGRRVRATVYADEEGRLKDLPPNEAATVIWKTNLLRQDSNAVFRYDPVLFGPIVFVVNANQLEDRP